MGSFPAHVTAYLTMALCLFADDDYEEVATKVTGSLLRWGCWDAGWSAPTASGITQARKRLGPKVLAEVFEQVAGPVASVSTREAWLREWRLLAIDRFDVDVPDTEKNVAEWQSPRTVETSGDVILLCRCAHPACAARPAGQAPAAP
jgi:hypothetical protein